MPTELELEFNEAMMRIYIRAKKEADYQATRFFRMLSDHGGLETARILINSAQPSEGYTALWERGRLDLTVEALVLDPKWYSLFSRNDIDRARQRLKDYGYIIS